jgi:hypothetical protein
MMSNVLRIYGPFTPEPSAMSENGEYCTSG